MKLSLPRESLHSYVVRLIENHLPDGLAVGTTDPALFRRALERVEHCFRHIQRKYYCDDGQSVFDHLNGDHMASLLYFYANTAWRDAGDVALATRLFYLNKILHSVDLFYSVAMPDIFMLVHPVGTVLGHARYGNYLVVYQNCTVGATTDVYPRFGEGAILYSRSSVLGDCTLGNDVVMAANAMIVDVDVPAATIVVGQYPVQRFVPNMRSVRSRCFEGVPVQGEQHC
jgi:serine O-acetyltransferase